MKKIGILTQPLHDNYGGLLQAYALKEVLQSLNYEVVIIDRRKPKLSRIRLALSRLKKMILKQKINPKDYLTSSEQLEISQHTQRFRAKYIPSITETISSDFGMKKLNSMGFYGYVVGSDQCWRPKYSPKISNYFLDFAKNVKGIKRVSYAASFGVSNWEFNNEDTMLCSRLAQIFDALSVREDSGVELVKNYLKRDAIHVLDPTMLLAKEHYVKITEQDYVKCNSGKLKVYILDRTESKEILINNIESKLGLEKFEVLPKKRFGLDDFKNIQDFVYPGPIQWLQGYRDAKFVITDSFHGSVFAILFNIPFIVIPNSNRGVARFSSLLNKFGLGDRMISDTQVDVENLIDNDIDWRRVNQVLSEERVKSLNFLRESLS